MAKIVRISTIGTESPPPAGTHSLTLQKLLTHLEGILKNALADKPDLILLPEVCDMPGITSYEGLHEFCHYRGDSVDRFLRDICKKNRVHICYGSFRDGGDGWFRNSSILIGRQGETLGIYNKNHLVLEEFTQSRVKFGKEPELMETEFGKVGSVICYDLQFDELREKYAKLRPELLLFHSLFPGGFLKQHWAFSTGSWLISSLGMRSPSCEAVNPLGQVVAQSSYYLTHMTVNINLDYCIAHLDYNREQIAAMKRKYGPLVQVDAPSGLGRALITSFSDTLSAVEMAREFDIELIDELFARNLACRHAEGNIEM